MFRLPSDRPRRARTARLPGAPDLPDLPGHRPLRPARRWRPVVAALAGALAAALLPTAGPAAPASAATSDLATVTVGTTWADTDGEPVQGHGGDVLEHNGYYYWVGENRAADNHTFVGISLYRSRDLAAWTYLGDILTSASAPALADCKVERPKLLYNSSTGTFVLWAHWETADSYAASHLLVATSSTIGGAYTFQRHFRPGAGSVTTADSDPTYTGGDSLWGYGSRDFTVYQDPDSRDAYLVSAQDSTSMRVYRLTDDYTDVDWQSSYALFAGKRREAPALTKVGDRYVLVTSAQSGWYANQALYSWTTDMTDPDGWSALAPLGNNTTFRSQPTDILRIDGKSGTSYVYLGDRWDPDALGSSTYVWLPLQVGDPDGTGDPGLSMDYAPQWQLDAQAGTVVAPAAQAVSVGATVTASAQTAAHPATHANDGIAYNLNTSGDNTNYYGPGTAPFTWTVDLGVQRTLARVDVAWRSYNGSETYSGYTLQASTDGVTWSTLADRRTNTTTGFTTDAATGQARYVRVVVQSVVNDHNGNSASWAAGIVEATVYATS